LEVVIEKEKQLEPGQKFRIRA